MEVKECILSIAQNLFFKQGIKSVSIDDISEEMSMSKKTFYKFFPSKDEIITTLVENHIQRDMLEIDKIRNNSEDAIEELIGICEFSCEMVKMTDMMVSRNVFIRIWFG